MTKNNQFKSFPPVSTFVTGVIEYKSFIYRNKRCSLIADIYNCTCGFTIGYKELNLTC